MRWQDIEDEREKYAAYLCSREWAEKREIVIEREGNLCERCLHNPIHAVHHKTYIRKYDEAPGDLEGLCFGCHEFNHGKSDIDPRDKAVLPKLTEFGGGRLRILCPVCDSEEISAVDGKWQEFEGPTGPIYSLRFWCVEGQHTFHFAIEAGYDVTTLFTGRFKKIPSQDG